MLADDLECGVCLADFPASASYTLSSCGHSLHRPCLRENAVQRLRAGDVQLSCYEPGCGLALLDSDLATLLDGEEGAETMRRLARRRLERSEPSVRFCPAAGCDSEVRGGSAQSPELTCRSCGTGFCFLHNTAHAAGRAACQAYALRERESPEHAASVAEIGRNSRPCPRPACGTLVERAGGCNSIVCARCGTTFCWLCGVEITPGELPIHYQVRRRFSPPCPLTRLPLCSPSLPAPRARPTPMRQWWNIKSDCRFRQFVDTGGQAISPGLRALLNLTTVVYALFFGIPSMAITAVLCLVLPCCSIPAFRLSSEGTFVTFMTLSSIVASLVLMLGLCLLAAPVVLPLLVLAAAYKGVRYCCFGSDASEGGTAAAAAAAAPEQAAAAAAAAAAAPPAQTASAASSLPLPSPARQQHLSASGDVYVSLSTPPRSASSSAAPLGAAASAAAAAAAAGQEVEVRLTFTE